MSGHRPDQGGIALVLVLWVITLLTSMALAVIATSRTESLQIRNRVAEAQFRAHAEAALQYTALRLAEAQRQAEGTVNRRNLSSAQQEALWRPDGNPRGWEFAGQALEVRIFDEAARVDLNKSPTTVLNKLLQQLGVSDKEADALVHVIADWRDTDTMRQSGGAESPDYSSTGSLYGSKNEDFDAVEELSQVLGMPRSLYVLLEPLVTVYSESGEVRQDYADPLVRAALGQEQSDSISAEPGMGGPLYRIQISYAKEAMGPRMEALARVAVGEQNPLRVLWRRYSWTAPIPMVEP